MEEQSKEQKNNPKQTKYNLLILESSKNIFFSSHFILWYVSGSKGLSLIIDLTWLIKFSAFSIFISLFSLHLWGFFIIYSISSVLSGSLIFYKFFRVIVIGILHENFLQL